MFADLGPSLNQLRTIRAFTEKMVSQNLINCQIDILLQVGISKIMIPQDLNTGEIIEVNQ